MSSQTNQQGTSSTQTITQQAVLHLRASISPPPPIINETSSDETVTPDKEAPEKKKSKVQWQEGTVDNENLNRKKSKICCIFHPQRDFESEEPPIHEGSSSSSSSSSESESDEELRKKKIQERRKRKGRVPNSYEFQPDYRNNHNQSEDKCDHRH